MGTPVQRKNADATITCYFSDSYETSQTACTHYYISASFIFNIQTFKRQSQFEMNLKVYYAGIVGYHF